MVQSGVIAALLFGLVVFPFVAIALHLAVASAERRNSRDDVEPQSTHDTYRDRTIPGGGGRRGE